MTKIESQLQVSANNLLKDHLETNKPDYETVYFSRDQLENR